MFIPTGQNLEDVLLWRCFAEIESGTYLDVGAGEYGQPSVTQSFYDIGWSGILIDPVPSYEEVYKLSRPHDIFLSIAAGANHEPDSDFFEIVGGFSTLSQSTLKMHQNKGLGYEIHKVDILTLDSIWESNKLTDVHFLKIDVEGYEMEVLTGLNLKKYRPWIVIIEVAIPGTTNRSEIDFAEYLSEFNYEFVYHDGLNDFFLAGEHLKLKKHFDLPINVGDGPWFISSSQLRFNLFQQEILINDLRIELNKMERLYAQRERWVLQFLGRIFLNKMWRRR